MPLPLIPRSDNIPPSQQPALLRPPDAAAQPQPSHAAIINTSPQLLHIVYGRISQPIRGLLPKFGPQPVPAKANAITAIGSPETLGWAGDAQPIRGLRPTAGPQPLPSNVFAAISEIGVLVYAPMAQPVRGLRPAPAPQPLVLDAATATPLLITPREVLPSPFQPVPGPAVAGAQPPNRTWTATVLSDFLWKGLSAPPVPGPAVAGAQPLVRIAWFSDESQLVSIDYADSGQSVPGFSISWYVPQMAPTASFIAEQGQPPFTFAFVRSFQPTPGPAIAGGQPLSRIAWYLETFLNHFTWRGDVPPPPGAPITPTGPQPLVRIAWFGEAAELNMSWRAWPQPVPGPAVAGAQPPNRTWLPTILSDFLWKGLTAPPVPGPAVAGAQPPNISWLASVVGDFLWKGLTAPPIIPGAVAGAQPPNISWLAFLGAFRDIIVRSPLHPPVPGPATAGAQPPVVISWMASALELAMSWRPWPQPIPPNATAGAQPPNGTWLPYTNQPLPTSFVPWPHPQPVPGPAVAGAQPLPENWLTQGEYQVFVWRGDVAPPVPGPAVAGTQPLVRIAWFGQALPLNFAFEPWPQPVPGPATAGAQPPNITWVAASSFLPDFRWVPGPQPVPGPAVAGMQPGIVNWLTQGIQPAFRWIGLIAPPVPGPAVAGPQPLVRIATFFAAVLEPFTWRGLSDAPKVGPALSGDQPRMTAAGVATQGQPPTTFIPRLRTQPLPPEASAGYQPRPRNSTIKERFVRAILSVTRYFSREEPHILNAPHQRLDSIEAVETRATMRTSYTVRIGSSTGYRRVPVGEEASGMTRVLSNNVWQNTLSDNLAAPSTDPLIHGATVTLTLEDPNGSVVLNAVSAPEVGTTGTYRYESVASVCPIPGIYKATWDGLDLSGKRHHRVDLVQVTLT